MSNLTFGLLVFGIPAVCIAGALLLSRVDDFFARHPTLLWVFQFFLAANFIVSWKALPSMITWSAGKTIMVAAWSRSATQAVPSAMAAAVSRLSGSATIFSFGKFFRIARTDFSWSTFVSTRIRSVGIQSEIRATVSSSNALSEISRSNCLGVARRLSGQKRSPLPPARMRA